MKKNLISIIIPVYNEENYIENCLNSVLSFEKPDGFDFEVLIGDGNSNDKTVKLIKKFQNNNNNNIFLFNNPHKYQSFAMNIGLKISKGEFILRLDAHAKYPKNYLRLCYESLLENDVDNSGGIFITQPGSSSFSAILVQALSTHKFGVGDASFRTEEVPGFADTVPYGFYRKSIFKRIGYFDERLIRCQDYEFNSRIIASGGKIWRNPKIKVFYYNQPSLYKFLKKQFYIEAPFNPYLWYLAPYSFTYRHAITGLFSFGFICGLLTIIFDLNIKYIFIGVMILYVLLALLSSFQQTTRFSNYKLIFFLPISFFLFHFVHGLGILKGVFFLMINKSPVQSFKEPWKDAGRFYGLKNYKS